MGNQALQVEVIFTVRVAPKDYIAVSTSVPVEAIHWIYFKMFAQY